jgi:hypothetical protein
MLFKIAKISPKMTKNKVFYFYEVRNKVSTFLIFLHKDFRNKKKKGNKFISKVSFCGTTQSQKPTILVFDFFS